MESISYAGALLTNESLASYTTWRVGGIASRIYKPLNLQDLEFFLKNNPFEKEPLLFLGLGSNALIRDGGFKGTVVITQGSLKDVMLQEDNTVRVEAGVSCASMARFCARNGLSGAEFWAGIPGTMGGALRMNAGCYGSETWQYVKAVETIDRAGNRKMRTPDTFTVSYRHVEGLDDNEWFVAAYCQFPSGDKEVSLQKIKSYLAHRAETQPTNEYNCGSVFRNPPSDFAARIIESCGFKGHQVGGAVVSEKHANFIINHEGKAKAADIESLIELIRSTVMDQLQIRLVHEVHIIGDAT